MVRTSRFRVLPLACLLLSASAAARQGSSADYERSAALRELTRSKVSLVDVRPNWLPDGSRFWYLRAERGSRTFLLVDPTETDSRPAFDHERLAAKLSEAAQDEFDAQNLPFRSFEYTEDGSAIQFEAAGYHWTCALKDYACTRGEQAEPREERRRGRRGFRGFGRDRSNEPLPSPDGKWKAVVRDHNLYLSSASDDREFPLSHDGSEDFYYGAPTWSPDSRLLIAYRIVPGDVKDVHVIETSPDDQLEAKLRTRPYARPGDRFPSYEMHIFSVVTKEGWPAEVEPIDFHGPPRLRWKEDHLRFTYEKRDRGHQRDRVIEVDASTGTGRILIDERADTFIDDYHKHYLHHVGDGEEFLWTSERDGWNHLYLYDGEQGVLKNQITHGPWVIRSVERVDEVLRRIWFLARGMNPYQDPYYQQLCRVDFDGSGLVALTKENGTHSIAWSPSGEYFLDTYSRADLPPITNLCRADGSSIMTLAEGDVSELLATGWQYPEAFHADGRDGVTDIWGLIYRPTNFDESLSYPVIESIYAGPHDSHVPKSFRAYSSSQALAELGFIVVQIDGMGTNNRSKAFHDVCWQNLGDAGFPDRILWMQAAAKRFPQMDLERVGIHGTSAGGQNALGALLFHPAFYKVGVASCGCHDNRLDKASWNEQWMGYPVGPHYAEQSNVTNAHKLEGKLLLMVGELDSNVPPESTYRVVDALIEADKDFDFFPLPGQGHTGGGAYGERRRRDFFVRHLLGVEPRWEPEVATEGESLRSGQQE